jgi:hypothetical protein
MTCRDGPISTATRTIGCPKETPAIVDPDGTVVAGPLVGEEGILFADIDLNRIRIARQQFDACGHYSRGDVLELRVSRPTSTVEMRSNLEEVS